MAAAMRQILDDYGAQVRDDVETATAKVANEAKAVIAAAGKYQDHPGRKQYRKSCTVQKGQASYVGSLYRLFNKLYQLTHLLENGHDKRDGTRTRAFPHFSVAADYVRERLPEAVKEELGK